jgi:15-cis-phytoene synthase
MTPDEYVQDRVARSGSSFYYAFMFLPPQKRAAITAFYAFCREVDDVVDESTDSAVAGRKLDWWRGEIKAAFQGQGSHPAMKALWPHVGWANIRQEQLRQVIEGCQLDLQQTRFLDYPSLKSYCHLVAGVVGEVASSIFGARSEATLAYARQLGQAMQLTNIIRDVGDDARRGRIYIPMTDLQKFGVRAQELLMREAPWGYSDRFQALMQFQAERAHALYDEALALLPESERADQKPGLMMANIYRTLLRDIERQHFAVLHQRTSLTPLRKLWIAARTHVTGR